MAGYDEIFSLPSLTKDGFYHICDCLLWLHDMIERNNLSLEDQEDYPRVMISLRVWNS